MSEITDFEAFHIRKNEMAKGTWSDDDERIYQSAQQSVEPTCSTCGVSGGHKFNCPKYGLPRNK